MNQFETMFLGLGLGFVFTKCLYDIAEMIHVIYTAIVK